tara:strand:+ start:2047 stop:2181 length:135 start_codon:yes stop_codon:yes gene_type:complete
MDQSEKPFIQSKKRQGSNQTIFDFLSPNGRMNMMFNKEEFSFLS